MATADRILTLKLVGDVSSINKTLKGTQGRMRSMARSAASWTKAMGIGLAIEGIEELGSAIGTAWTGFREGEQASAQLATTWRNLGNDGDDLQATIDAISESTLKLGTDDTEAINAFNEALKTTGGDSSSAMNRLRIAQDLVANGSAPNLSSALKIIQGAAKGSARVVDKFGLTADTAAGRVAELGSKVRGAAKAKADLDPLGVLFNAMNEDLEGIVGSLSSGDLEGAMGSLRDIGTHLGEAWDKVGPGITGVFDKLSGGAFSDVMTKLRELGDTVGPKVAETLNATSEAWGALQPHLSNALTLIQPVVDILSPALAGGLAFVLDAVNGALQLVTDLLKGDFSGAFDTITETVGKLGTDLNDFFVGLPGKLAEWAVEIATEASLLGQGILDGIIEWVTNLPADIGKIIQDAVDKIREIWNTIDLSIPAGSFQFWGPGTFGIPNPFGGYIAEVSWGAMGFDWAGSGDLIPDLAEGGIIKKRPGGMLARIGEGSHDEAVIPLDGHGGGMGGPTVIINVGVGDPAAIGAAVTKVLRAYRNAGGGPAIKAAVG